MGEYYIIECKKKLFFGVLIELMMEAYLEFVLTGYFNAKAPMMDTSGDFTSLIVGYASLFITIIAMPGIFIYLLQ